MVQLNDFKSTAGEFLKDLEDYVTSQLKDNEDILVTSQCRSIVYALAPVRYLIKGTKEEDFKGE